MTGVKTREFAEQNLGLVHLCANRFRGRGVEYDDLYGAGCIGLMKAVSGFDETRGVRFSTYAVPVILGEIKRVFRDGGAVKVARGLKELSLRAVRARDDFVMREGREPLICELSAVLGVSVEQTAEALSVSLPPVSLTEACDENGSEQAIPVCAPDTEVGDIIALRQLMSRLPERERKLLELRYFHCLTQTQTAKILGMTQVQVSRLEKRILTSMRSELLE